MITVVVGLGNLGLAIARRLTASDVVVAGVDPSAEARRAWLDAAGPEVHADLAGVDWSTVASVFVVVRLTSQAGDVLAETACRATPGTPCYVVTTLDAEFASGLGQHRHRLDVVELPVSGGAVGALAGELTVMAAGPLTDERRAFLRSTLAAHLVELARYGQPTLVKLLNNVLSAYNAMALAEMLVLARRQGVDPARVHEVILTATGRSFAADYFDHLMEDLLEKDIELLGTTAGALPVVDLAQDFSGRLATARAVLAAATEAEA